MENHSHMIFLVDDDLDDVEMLSLALQTINPDYDVLQAQNGKEALAKLQEMKETGHLPCLIVMDINMPKMDGKQALIAIQEDQKLSSIPVVMLSTSSSIIDKMFFQKKEVAMMTKPVDFKAFQDTAVKLLGYCKT